MQASKAVMGGDVINYTSGLADAIMPGVCKNSRESIPSRDLVFKGIRWFLVCLIVCASLMVFTGLVRATGYGLSFQHLDVLEIKNDAASRFYYQVTGQRPTALRRTTVGTHANICGGQLTLYMLDQMDIQTDRWAVFTLSCPVKGSSTANTLTLVAKRNVWKQCCTGVEDPERDFTALTFTTKGGVLLVRPTTNGFELESILEKLEPIPPVGKF